MATYVTKGALLSRVSRLRRLTLARAWKNRDCLQSNPTLNDASYFIFWFLHVHPHLFHGNSRWKSMPNAQGFLAGFWLWQTVCFWSLGRESGMAKVELARRLLFHVTAAWRIHQKYSKLFKRRTPLESGSHKWTKILNFILYSKRLVWCKNTDKEVLNGNTAWFRPRTPVRNTLQDSSIHSGRGEKSLVLICRSATCDIAAGAACDTVPIWEQKSPATEVMSVYRQHACEGDSSSTSQACRR